MRTPVRAVLAWALVVCGALLLPGAARAEVGDVVTSFDISYTIQPDGRVQVVEEIDYQFATANRHGIYRTLVTRQPFSADSDDDVVYEIDDIEVSSPDAPDDVDTSTERQSSRLHYLRLRIGDPDETIPGRTASYRISYEITGALRTIDGIPELYWNATGNDWDAEIASARVTVTAPEGTTSLSCYAGATGSDATCPASTEGETAVFEASDLAAGEGVTISAQLPPGSVQNATLTVVPQETAASRAHVGPVTLGGSTLAGVLAIGYAFWTRRAMRDRRYGGVAPGISEPTAPVVPDDIPGERIPVQFNPPNLPPELAGSLLHGTPMKRVTAATLLELANRGALGIRAEPKGDDKKFRKSGGVQRTAYATDRDRAEPGYQRKFLNAIAPPSTNKCVLDGPTASQSRRFAKAATALHKRVVEEHQARGWVEHPSRAVHMIFAPMLAALAVIAVPLLLGLFGVGALAYAVPLLVIAVGLGAVSFLRYRGRRTAEGRAVVDQVEGFRRYLATAEAGQLRFEEGRDIFSAYLPWAVVFDLAERWQRVCAELAAEGRITDNPAWYQGPLIYHTYSGNSFGGSLTSSVSASTASGTSSGTGGGGSAGGGGGGGGGGSW